MPSEIGPKRKKRQVAVIAFLSRSESRSGLSYNTLAIPVVLTVVLVAAAHGFATWGNLTNLSSQIAALVVVSLGQLMVALIGGIDLSVGSVISLVSCVLATPGWPLSLTLPLSLGVGFVVGLINGWGVAVMGINPIVMTLSSMTFVQGATLVWQKIPGGIIPAGLRFTAVGNTLGIPHSFAWLVLCILIIAVVLTYSRFGLRLFAVGGNPVSARLNGIPVRRMTISAYVVCSVLAVVSGVYLAGRIGSGDPKIGVSFGLDSLTAIALGGTQLSGGIGGVASAVIGAVSLGLIGNGMNLLGVSPFLQSAAKGVLLVIAICAQRRKSVGV
jgi:ribose transport system permease protein